MKDHTIFECAVIGFLFGVIVATYAAFLDGNGGHLGYILSLVSLRPVGALFALGESNILVTNFLVAVIAFTLYGLIAGYVVKNYKKSKFYIIGIVVLLIVGVLIEQKSQPFKMADLAIVPVVNVASLGNFSNHVQKEPQQYFGNEVKGDLNGDGKDDVVFVIPRDDEKLGTIYYLTATLADDKGHAGTNLLFLGPNSIYLGISENSGIVNVTYSDRLTKKKANMYAMYIDGKMQWIKAENVKDSLFWGEIGVDGSTFNYRLCDTHNWLPISAGSSTISQISTTFGSSSASQQPLFAALIGRIADTKAKTSNSKTIISKNTSNTANSANATTNIATTSTQTKFFADKVIKFAEQVSCN